MIEFLMELKPELLGILKFLTLPFFVFIISMAHMYVWTVMLQVVESIRIKNIIILFTILGSYVLYYFIMNAGFGLESFWYTILYGSITIIMHFLYLKFGNVLLEKIFKVKIKNKKGK